MVEEILKIVDSIRSKKEFSSLDDDFVTEKVKTFLLQNRSLAEKLVESGYNVRSSLYKQVVKEIRSSLREVYGVFQRASQEKKYSLLERLSSAKGRNERLKIIYDLLSTHQSTFERKEHYKTVYHDLFKKIGAPKTILDLGCGLNPLAYNFIGSDPKYFCCDISSEDMAFVQSFFDEEGIDGRSFKVDMLDPEERKRYLSIDADVIFMFKLIDTLESQVRNISKTIIRELVADVSPRFIVVSFPTKSIGGRIFRVGVKENWFSRFLKGENISWGVLTVEGEEFWVLSV